MEGFHIINKLGEGAYSTVLKVTRAEDGNTYALKKVRSKNSCKCKIKLCNFI